MALRKLREAIGLTQDQVAASVGVGQTTVSGWESGKTPVPQHHLPGLARQYRAATTTVERAVDETRAAWLRSRDVRLARAIKEHRDAAGLSQPQVAALCDVSDTAVSRWERAGSRPRRENLIRLAEVVSATPEDILVQAGWTEQEITAYMDDDGEFLPLASLLRQARRDAGLTQHEVAESLGISQTHVSHVETTPGPPRRWLLTRLMELYGLKAKDVDRAYRSAWLERGQLRGLTDP